MKLTPSQRAFGSWRSWMLLILGVVVPSGLASRAATPKFFDDDPIWKEPITQDVKSAARYEPDLAYQSLENLFWRPGDKVLGQRAKNINTVDEVPDSNFFVNRAGLRPLTSAIVARASNLTNGPAPGKWVVVSAKSDGVSPGFTIRDTANQIWFIKFDPPGWPGMSTGTEVVASKLFWAVGYHTAEYHIARLVTSNLEIGAETRIAPMNEMPRQMKPSDIAWLLSRADQSPDGSYRVIASKGTPGRPVGRLGFHGTRADDPNDIVPHEHRRELRGYFVFAAWLNHVDAKGINSLSSLVTENGRTFIRHYLLDFSSALGSASIMPREGWEGYEPLVENTGDIGKRILAFGFAIPEWRTMEFFESRSIGRLPRDHTNWNPVKWSPHITNAAFRHMRPDDTFWAAQKVAAISDDMIRAAVAEGQFNDPPSEEFLAKAIRERRTRVLQMFLPAVNPVIDPAIAAGQLTFSNAAVTAGVSPDPKGYLASWFTFDNNTGQTTPLGTVKGPDSPLPTPALPASGFVKVEISAVGGPDAWSKPISVYFRKKGADWFLVGLERMP
ncbi:MAG: hypothetical protein ACRD2N_04340 [Vicinamibacterales bacterium]